MKRSKQHGRQGRSRVAPRRKAVPSTAPTATADEQRARRLLQKRLDGGTLSKRDTAFLQRYQQKREAAQREEIYHGVQQVLLLELLQVSCKTLREWEAKGMPVAKTGRPKQYDLYAILPWLRKHYCGDDNEISEARQRLLAERILKTRVERMIMEGEMITRAEKEAQDAAKYKDVETGLRNMVKAMLPILESVTSPADRKQVIDDHVDYLLRGFAGELDESAANGSVETSQS